ncbi:hypothetical protein DFJ77DRAFT_188560 [Powellomyces hirtus]|nr:hypothetical protein DFJ77DRAFT_188560 [Powellomyces hirtus]
MSIAHFGFILLSSHLNISTKSHQARLFNILVLYALILPVTFALPIVAFKKKPLHPWLETAIVCLNGFVFAFSVMARSVMCKVSTPKEATTCEGTQTFSAAQSLYATLGPLFMIVVFRLDRGVFLGAAFVMLSMIAWILSSNINAGWQTTAYLGGFYIWTALMSYWIEVLDREKYILQQELSAQIQCTERAQGGEMREAASKRRFVSYIFHEIRVPFNTAVLGLHNMEDEGLFSGMDKSQKAVLDAVKSSFGMMESVLNDVLDFEKMEQGKFELHCRPFDVNATAQGVAYAFHTVAHDKGIRLTTTLDETLAEADGGWVIGDDVRYRQVLNNFVSNSLKFTPPGGHVTISISIVKGDTLIRSNGHNTKSNRTLHDRSPTVTIRTSVTDTGCGIAPDDVKKMFQPYQQINSWATQNGKGTGLGLAICKHIIEMAGGSCGVESFPSCGSTFWFEIEWPVADQPININIHDTLIVRRSSSSRLASPPLCTGHEEADDAVLTLLPATSADSTNNVPAEPGSPTRTVPYTSPSAITITTPPLDTALSSFLPSIAVPVTRTRPLHILVVDDDRITRMLMIRLLSRLGHTLQIAEDGRQAVDLIALHNPGSNTPAARWKVNLLPSNTTAPPTPPHETHPPPFPPSPPSLNTDTPALRPTPHPTFNASPRATTTHLVPPRIPFDVVLMDNQMPRLTGVDAVAQLRRLGISVPVVGITGNALKEDQDQFLASGADMVITKPLKKEMLVRALDLIP